MMEAVRTSETSVDNHFTRQYIPEDNSEQYIHLFLIPFNLNYVNALLWKWCVRCVSKKVLWYMKMFERATVKRARVLRNIDIAILNIYIHLYIFYSNLFHNIIHTTIITVTQLRRPVSVFQSGCAENQNKFKKRNSRDFQSASN
jgi:hypothetical protein